jgi:hypothetical protein
MHCGVIVFGYDGCFTCKHKLPTKFVACTYFVLSKPGQEGNMLHNSTAEPASTEMQAMLCNGIDSAPAGNARAPQQQLASMSPASTRLPPAWSTHQADTQSACSGGAAQFAASCVWLQPPRPPSQRRRRPAAVLWPSCARPLWSPAQPPTHALAAALTQRRGRTSRCGGHWAALCLAPRWAARCRDLCAHTLDKGLPEPGLAMPTEAWDDANMRSYWAG